MTAYLCAWILALVVAAALAARHPGPIRLLRPEYWRFLAVRWRLVTFVIATLALAGVAPYTGDPTWDYWDASFMALLTFATAPWSVGCLFRVVRGERSWVEIYVATCAWLFSASWSYDLYILVRDGIYPPSWLANLGASSILYLSGGLFWSLDWRPGRGVTFAFLENDWPSVAAGSSFHQVMGYGLAFMTLVTATLAYVFLL